MADTCRCGSPVRYRAAALACIACGTECCPCCTIMSESAPYCVSCFETFLDDVSLGAGPDHGGLLERRRQPPAAAYRERPDLPLRRHAHPPTRASGATAQ